MVWELTKEQMAQVDEHVYKVLNDQPMLFREINYEVNRFRGERVLWALRRLKKAGRVKMIVTPKGQAWLKRHR